MHILRAFKTRSKARTHLISFPSIALPPGSFLPHSSQRLAGPPSWEQVFWKISRLERKPRGSSLSILIRSAAEAYCDIQVFQQSSTILSDAQAVRVQVCNN
jgi:hypothetical protein